MPLNIHPIFTHFPIALLTLYSFFEILRFKKIMEQPYWFYVKAMFVLAGTLIGFATLYTGSLVESEFSGKLIETHSFWAGITMTTFSIISVGYLVTWIEKTAWAGKIRASWFATIWNILVIVKNFLQRPPVAIILALFGGTAIMITGALGGALAYGPDIDPIVHLVYTLLIGKAE